MGIDLNTKETLPNFLEIAYDRLAGRTCPLCAGHGLGNKNGEEVVVSYGEMRWKKAEVQNGRREARRR